MRYEEAWARLLLARAAARQGSRAEEAARERACRPRLGASSPICAASAGKAAAWLADAFSDSDPSLLGAAADPARRVLDEFPDEEREAYVEAAGVQAMLDRWTYRAREALAVRGAALSSTTTAEHLARAR